MSGYIKYLIVFACYTLSLPAIFAMFGLLGEGFRSPHKSAIPLACIWLGAWLCHAVMSAAWVINVRLGHTWTRTGLSLGILSFLVWPAYSFTQEKIPQEPIQHHLFGQLFTSSYIIIIQAAITAPAILLAAYLIKYHGIKPQAPKP
jgi:hypothetical protein